MKNIIKIAVSTLLIALFLFALPSGQASTVSNSKILNEWVGETLVYKFENFVYNDAIVYAVTFNMKEPGRQIKKEAAEWEKDLQIPSKMLVDSKAVIAINGSGFISSQFPNIPDDYPGESSDYFMTSWGSLVITHGEVLRNLKGLKFSGLSLQKDGLHMHWLEPIEEVLKNDIIETWSFYDFSVLIKDGVSQVDNSLNFNINSNSRTVIAKLKQGYYLILSVTNTNGGLDMMEVTSLLMKKYDPEWAFNLDGNGSCAFLMRYSVDKNLEAIYGDRKEVADVLYITE